MKMLTSHETKRQLVEHRNYSSKAHFQTKLPVIFRGTFDIYHSILQSLCVYSPTFCGTSYPPPSNVLRNLSTEIRLRNVYVRWKSN
jgi:hypothetical protein